MTKKRFLTTARASLCCLLLALALALSGCGQPQAPAALDGTADNDILTFSPNRDNRPVIRIGTQYYTPDTSLHDALQARFPDYLFVMDYGAAAGVNSESRLEEELLAGTYYDLLVSGNMQDSWFDNAALFTDLSGESFLDNYLLTSLNSVSVDGHIYSLPGTATLAGIAYNADMFAAQGWQPPQTYDEFFALCDTIAAQGITPFTSCCKYDSAVARLFTSMTYAQLFEPASGAAWLAGLATGESHFVGFMEPIYELAAAFRDHGAITADYFTASLTQQRQDFWAGKTAMIDYDSAIYTYAQAENASFDVGIIPYPAAG